MVGGGALFFALQPSQALLADANQELVNFYREVRDHSDELCLALNSLTASPEEYYRRRAERPLDPFDRAVRFYYLNRLCWNGLHRVNRRGEFNVPFGGRLPERIVDSENLFRAKAALQSAHIVHADFAETVSLVQEKDFVYFDPPYPKGAPMQDGFDRYNQTRFSFEDHKRLAKVAKALVSRGVLVMLTESAIPEVLELFRPRFRVELVSSNSLVAAQARSRGKVKEAILTSYDL